MRVGKRALFIAAAAMVTAGRPALAQPAAPSAEAQDVEEVVITATQRPSGIQNVPTSVTVFSGAQLHNSGIDDVKHLVSLSPSLGTLNSISESFGQLLRIRGVASSGADIGLESAAGITIDGVPLSRPNLSIADLQGLDRIEVLRGPQGTLFGKNATSGTINILTLRPTFTPEYSGSVTGGNRGTGQIRMTANGALSGDVLAGRLDALYTTADGYVENATTGKSYGGREAEQLRGQLLYVPNAAFDLRLIADYFHHDGTINAPVYRVVGGPVGAAIASLSGHMLVAHFDAADLTQIDDVSPRFDRSVSAGTSATADWRSGLGHIVAIASYRMSDFRRSYDVDNSPADLVRDPRDGERYDTVTAEVRLQGRTGNLDHLIGAYFGRENIASRDSYQVGTSFETYANLLGSGMIPLATGLPLGSNYPAGTGVLDNFKQHATDFAVFTHDIYDVTDRISVALGARYTTESKSLGAAISSNNPGCFAAVAAHGVNLTGIPSALQGVVCIPNLDPRYDGTYSTSRSEGNWSGIASLNGKITENLNAYVSYSRGYKGGGFQLDRSGMDPTAPSLSQLRFRAETADSYEVGIKGATEDGMFRASVAAFHTQFHDYQFSYFTGLNRRTQNVPDLTTKGFEIETWFHPLEALEFSAAATYQETIFGTSGFPTGLTQLQGTTGPIAPRWIVVGTAQYTTSVPGSGLDASAYFDMRWQSRSYVGGSAVISPNFVQDPYALVDARFALGPPEGRWRIELWARNLFDQHAWSILNNTTLQPGSISGYVIEPRSYGITTSVKW